MRLRTVLLAVPAAATLLMAPAAHADWRGHGYGSALWVSHHHGGIGVAPVIAGAVVGLGVGAVVAGVLAPPVVVAPPPVMYAPPPQMVYAPPPQVVYAPPVMYAPPPRVVYAPAPAYYGW